MELEVLKTIYLNTETEEELVLSLQHHGISKSEFFKLAEKNDWQSNPFIDGILLGRKDPETRLFSIFNYTATRLQQNAADMSVADVIATLDSLVKIREKINRLDEDREAKETAALFDSLTEENDKDDIIAKELFKKAASASGTPAAVYWLKAHAKWKEADSRIELTGKDGDAISTITRIIIEPNAKP